VEAELIEFGIRPEMQSRPAAQFPSRGRSLRLASSCDGPMIAVREVGLADLSSLRQG